MSAYPMPPLVDGIIVRRYRRFLADVQLADGTAVTAHCPNTGAMTTCWKPGAPVQLSQSENPKRKYRHTLERVDMGRGWVGVNTARVNHIIAHAIASGDIAPLSGYRECRREITYQDARFDFHLRQNSTDPGAFVEVKNATLLIGDTIQFPDAITRRGYKHLKTLTHAHHHGHRAILLFAINRPEGTHFTPAHHIDPAYATALEQAQSTGLQILTARLKHTADGVVVVT